MAKKRKKQRKARSEVPAIDYVDEEGNVLVLRQSLSAGTIRKIGEGPASAASARALL